MRWPASPGTSWSATLTLWERRPEGKTHRPPAVRQGADAFARYEKIPDAYFSGQEASSASTSARVGITRSAPFLVVTR